MTKTKYPSFLEALLVWFKIAIYSFGGPANQIAVMHKLVVEEKKWVSETRFLNALNYCMLLPGPEAQQLVIYLGWLLHRYRGGLAAGILFILPGIISILILSLLYAKYQSLTLVQTFFFGIKAAVIAIVIQALISIGRKTLKNISHMFIALGAFVGIFFFNIPFPIIILSAALLGFFLGKYAPGSFNTAPGSAKKDLVFDNSHIVTRTFNQTLFITSIWLIIWLTPVLLCLFLLGTNHVFTQEGIFFTKTAIVSFGGAYAVLAYISLQSVQYFHWLHPGEMLDGLGMAETMPGPLIKVVQFVGFMGAYRFAGSMDPVVAGIIGSLLSAWVTFVPAFLFIFAGAPYIEILRKKKNLQAAMSAITAAVVGVILNLTIWFTIHALFHTVNEKKFEFLRLYIPAFNTFDYGTFLIMLFALLLVFVFRAGIFTVLGCSVLLGFIIKMLHPIFNF